MTRPPMGVPRGSVAKANQYAWPICGGLGQYLHAHGFRQKLTAERMHGDGIGGKTLITLAAKLDTQDLQRLLAPNEDELIWSGTFNDATVLMNTLHPCLSKNKTN